MRGKVGYGGVWEGTVGYDTYCLDVSPAAACAAAAAGEDATDDLCGVTSNRKKQEEIGRASCRERV